MNSDKEPRVVRLANEYAAWWRRCEGQLRRWPRTWDQIEGTVTSVVANLGEALDSETMAQKRKYFGYAKASAGEALKLIAAVTRNGMLTPKAGEEGVKLLNDIRWDLVRLIRWARR